MKSDSHTTLEVAREALKTIILAYARLIISALPDTRKALRYSQKLGMIVRRHTRLHLLREDLSLSAKLRARVQRDLGGKMAMIKWERRRRDAKVLASCKAAKLAKGDVREWPRPAFDRTALKRERQSPRKPWAAKTDRYGHFRMAVIKTGKRDLVALNPRHRPVTNVQRRSVNFRPVEITTDDL